MFSIFAQSSKISGSGSPQTKGKEMSSELFAGKYDHISLIQKGYRLKIAVIDRGHVKLGFYKQICNIDCPTCLNTSELCKNIEKRRSGIDFTPEFVCIHPSWTIRRWATSTGLGWNAKYGPDTETLMEEDQAKVQFFVMRQIYTLDADLEMWKQFFDLKNDNNMTGKKWEQYFQTKMDRYPSGTINSHKLVYGFDELENDKPKKEEKQRFFRKVINSFNK